MSALHRRPEPEVFERAASWCREDLAAKRALGADILGQLGHVLETRDSPFAEQSLPILIRLLEDSLPEVLRSSIIALAHLSSRGCDWDPAQLSGPARHEDPDVRHAVAFALAGAPCNRYPLAVEIMLTLCVDPESEVRDWAVFGLGVQSEADSPSIREVLLARLDDEDVEVRDEAMVGLAQRSEERVIPVIASLIEEGTVSPLLVEAAGMVGAWIEADTDVPETVLLGFLEFAAANEDAEACLVLSRHRDEVSLLRKAAELGLPAAQRELGVLYAWGEKVPQDYAETRRWYALSAAAGDAEAQHDLGGMLMDGEGGPTDPEAALEWLEKSAKQNGPSSASAARTLSTIHEKGLHGVAADPEMAKRWSTREAEIDHLWDEEGDESAD